MIHVFQGNLPVAALGLTVLLLTGCGTTTVTPTFRTSDGLVRPDRVLVYDFAVSPDELEIKGGLDAQASGGVGSEAQTKEDIQVGRAFAKALTDSLVGELRSREIDAIRASEAAPPGQNTASIKGRFLRTSQRDGSTLVGFGIGAAQMRARIQIFQGTGANLRLVAEAESATQSNLKVGSGPVLAGTVAADAKRTGKEIAESIADYYRRQGWIK